MDGIQLPVKMGTWLKWDGGRSDLQVPILRKYFQFVHISKNCFQEYTGHIEKEGFLLVFLSTVVGVREGTLAAALLVGTISRNINKVLLSPMSFVPNVFVLNDYRNG